MMSPNNGTSLQFNIGEEGTEYMTTSMVQNWYPEIDNMTFAPK